jgi:hypothetical protein
MLRVVTTVAQGGPGSRRDRFFGHCLLFVTGGPPAGERGKTRQDLLEYCKKDTWAMVRLLDALRGPRFDSICTWGINSPPGVAAGSHHAPWSLLDEAGLE